MQQSGRSSDGILVWAEAEGWGEMDLGGLELEEARGHTESEATGDRERHGSPMTGGLALDPGVLSLRQECRRRQDWRVSGRAR